jgi:hypothetical protein
LIQIWRITAKHPQRHDRIGLSASRLRPPESASVASIQHIAVIDDGTASARRWKQHQ